MLTLPLMALWQGWAPPPVEFQPSLNLRSRLWLAGPAPLVGTRARLGLEATRLGVGAKVSLQVVREWLQQPGKVEPVGGPDSVLADGWISVQGELSENISGSLKMGRQAIEFEDGRIIGANDFELAGRFLDALRVDVELAPIHVSFVNARRFDDQSADPFGLGVNVLVFGANREVANLDWQVDGIAVVDARNTSRTSSTAGLYSRVEFGRLRTRAEGYLQNAGDGVGGLLSVRGGWVFGHFEGLVVEGSLDLATGHNGPWAAWQPVLGNSHEVWGRLDAWALASSYEDGGLGDLRLSANARLTSAFKLTGDVHRFFAPALTRGRGLETDLGVEWSLSPLVAVRGGGGYLLAQPESPNQGLGWVELDATF